MSDISVLKSVKIGTHSVYLPNKEIRECNGQKDSSHRAERDEVR